MFETYEEPTPAESDDYKPRDHYGHAAIVKVNEFRTAVPTVNGPADAVYADIHDLTLGQTFRNVMLMGGAFTDAFARYVGKGPLVIVWEKKLSASNRPYAIVKAANAEQIKAAADVYAKGDPFAPAVGTIDAEPPF